MPEFCGSRKIVPKMIGGAKVKYPSFRFKDGNAQNFARFDTIERTNKDVASSLKNAGCQRHYLYIPNGECSK